MSARCKLQSLGISTSLLREWTEREVAGPIPPDPDGSPLRAPLREALAVSPPNPDFDAGAGGHTEGAVRSTSAEGLLPPPALLPPPPALRARARGVSMAAEAGHRRDIGVRTRVRFAEGCLQGRHDAGSAGETEAAAVVVLAAVVAGTVAGAGRSVSTAAAGGVGSPRGSRRRGGDGRRGRRRQRSRRQFGGRPHPCFAVVGAYSRGPADGARRGGGGGQCGRRQQRSRRHFYRRPHPCSTAIVARGRGPAARSRREAGLPGQSGGGGRQAGRGFGRVGRSAPGRGEGRCLPVRGGGCPAGRR